MRKEHIVSAVLQIINEEAQKRNLTIEDKGTGHAFDGTVWDYLKDDSNIPEVQAVDEDYILGKAKGYLIKLRSFWGSPEVDIRDNGDLLVLTFSDTMYIDGEYVHTGTFNVHQVRVESYDYAGRMLEMHSLITRIQKNVEALEWKERDNDRQ